MIQDEPLFPSRTQAERRRHVIQALEMHPEYSDRRIARIAAVSRLTVKLMRSNMVRLKKIECSRRVGLDGKTYPPRKRFDHATQEVSQQESGCREHQG